MTAEDLPHEILSLIAKYTSYHKEDEPLMRLSPYALVNRAWQAAFEAEIYASVQLRDSFGGDHVTVGHEKPRPKNGMTLEKFNEITSGPQDWRRARRAAVRQISFLASVPHWLEDGIKEKWSADDDDGDDIDYLPVYDDILRRENDAAFTRAMQELFDMFSSWNGRTKHLTLSIVLQAENIYDEDMETEPGTHLIELDRDPLPDYLANLTTGTTLPPVAFVSGVVFPERVATPKHALKYENGISPPSQLRIISACGQCPAIVDVSLLATHWATLGGLQTKRDTLAESLYLLPPSVRTFSLKWNDELRDKECPEVPAIAEIIPVPRDALSNALHTISMQLRSIHIKHLNLTPDLFRLAQGETNFWPHLETIHLSYIPWVLPNGKSTLFAYSPPDVPPHGRGIPITHRGPDRLPYMDNCTEDNSIIATYFDDFLACAGRAAQKMPKLKNMLLSWTKNHELDLKAEGKGRLLILYSSYGYSPTTDVLEAWKLQSGQMFKQARHLRAVYESWPPK